MNHIIVGNGDYSRMLKEYLRLTLGVTIDAFTVAKEFMDEENCDGIPVVPAEIIHDQYGSRDTVLFMGIGYRNMNQIKKREYLRYKEMDYRFENYIHPTAIIGCDVDLGEGNNIFEGVIIQEGVKIGNANLIYGGAMISHDSIVGDYNSISVKSCVAGCSRIGNNCFIGANSTIRDHVLISDYVLVGAGTYVDCNLKDYEVMAPKRAELLMGKKSVDIF